MRHLGTRIHVAAPLGLVFELVADPRRYREWQTAIVSVDEVHGAWPAAGSSYSAIYEILGRRLHGHFVVTAAEPPTVLRVQGTTAGGWTSWSTRIESGDGQSIISVDLDYQLPPSMLAGALGPVAGFVLGRELRRTYEVLRVLAESESESRVPAMTGAGRDRGPDTAGPGAAVDA
jgi:hypothetical protein